jgi:hypothetical protein
MISSLAEFDNITAVGILARAALSLEDKDNPAAANKFPNELLIREVIINDVRRTLGISPDDISNTALDKLGDVLDYESNALIGEVNNDETLQRLADKGELPSDLFEINIISPIKDFFGKKYDAEKKLIEDTIRLSDNEQHYGQPSNQNDPCLISLFAKYFSNKYQNNSFTMLVAGQRNGSELFVHQAWRIYEGSILIEGITDLVDMLHRFADKFGAEIEFDGKKGHFFLTADLPNNSLSGFKINFDSKKHRSKKPNKITVTYFNQNNQYGTSKQASLIVAIDLDRYRKLLKSHGW